MIVKSKEKAWDRVKTIVGRDTSIFLVMMADSPDVKVYMAEGKDIFKIYEYRDRVCIENRCNGEKDTIIINPAIPDAKKLRININDKEYVFDNFTERACISTTDGIMLIGDGYINGTDEVQHISIIESNN